MKFKKIMSDIFSVTGFVVIVTGASRGIGHCMARAFAENGAFVVGLGRSKNPKNFDNENVEYISCDISDHLLFAKICKRTLAKYGKIDVLINGAGISLPSDQISKFDNTIQTNLRAPYCCSSIVFDVMKPKGRGSIINITSLSSQFGFPDNPSYVASKGGLRALSRALAFDYGKFGVRVNNIAPGYIRTPMTEKSFQNLNENTRRKDHTMLGRWGSPEDLIGAAIFLSSDASGYITGQDLFVDGGWSAKGLI
jgi:NAD(P)-dependent dehydrogenase (short-subunit alcohol dehydrogenase family)